jgi:pimeloyl-ACP methyl ester carboxylesterase
MLIPNATLIEIKDGGHLFMLSHAEETIAAMRTFLDTPHEVKQAA